MPESRKRSKSQPTSEDQRANAHKPLPACAAKADSATAAHARQPWRLGMALHFFAHLGLAADADACLAQRGLGRIHHRILYFSHFAPGISVGELLGVLRVTHQNTQRALKQLDQEGLIEFRPSKEDRRLKRLYCTPLGDQLLEVLTTRQQERIVGAYGQCTPRDVQGFFAVLSKMVDASDLQWLDRLGAMND